MRTPITLCAALLVLHGGAALAAQTTSTMLGPSETMVSTCAGLNTGFAWGPGGLAPMVTGRNDCQSTTTTQPGQAISRSVAYDENPDPVASKAAGTAQMGQLQLNTWMKGDNQNGLSAGFANAGWNDTLTIAPLDPALLGQIAYFEFKLHVTGSYSATNTANAGTGLSMIALRDDGFFGGAFVKQGFGVLGGFPVSETVDEFATLYVAAPVGSAFELGVFAGAYSSGGSSLPGPNEAENQFTITWQGISAVTVNGTPIAYNLISQSGIDWHQAFTSPVPEPASAWLMLAGAGLLLARRRAWS